MGRNRARAVASWQARCTSPWHHKERRHSLCHTGLCSVFPTQQTRQPRCCRRGGAREYHNVYARRHGQPVSPFVSLKVILVWSERVCATGASHTHRGDRRGDAETQELGLGAPHHCPGARWRGVLGNGLAERLVHLTVLLAVGHRIAARKLSPVALGSLDKRVHITPVAQTPRMGRNFPHKRVFSCASIHLQIYRHQTLVPQENAH